MKKRTDLFSIRLTQLSRVAMIIIVLILLSACGSPGGTGKSQPNPIDSTHISGGVAEKPTAAIKTMIIPSIEADNLTSTSVVTSTIKPSLTWTPTLPPPLPTPTPVWAATQTPAASELSGYIVFDDWPYPYTASQIFIADLATREIKQLTEVGSNGLPAWSPDGKKIAFSSRRDGLDDIYIMNLDGSSQAKLTQCAGKDIGSPAWSPDGRKIVFTGDCDQAGNGAIYTVDVITRQVTRLTEYGRYLDASWSSNGERIAYVVERKGNGYIHVMNSAGLEDQELVSTARLPVWCPDDTCLIYQAGYGKGYVGKLMILDLKTKAAKELLSPPNAAPKGVDEFLSSRSPVRGYVTYSVGPNLYAIDIKNNRIYSLGLHSFSGALYP